MFRIQNEKEHVFDLVLCYTVSAVNVMPTGRTALAG